VRKFDLSDNRMAAFEALPAIFFPGAWRRFIKRSANGQARTRDAQLGVRMLREG
jgi:hypothetical protein